MSQNCLVIGVSARALFDMEQSNHIYLESGLKAYLAHHQEREQEPLEPGSAFPLVSALLKLNSLLPSNQQTVEVVILSGLHPDAGVRIMESLKHYSLGVNRGAFTGGQDIGPYLEAFNVDLFLSQSQEDVQEAVNSGIAAAMMYAPPKDFDLGQEQIKIAFDGDAVLFSPESEWIYKRRGLAAFRRHEQEKAEVPMEEGPLAKFFKIICEIQSRSPEEKKPFRIALVTAREGAARERAMRTLRHWGAPVDEAYFLGGLGKDRILKAFRPHIFFDDQDVHLVKSSNIVPSAKVPYKHS